MMKLMMTMNPTTSMLRTTTLSMMKLGVGGGDSLVVGYSLMAHWVAASSLAVGMSLEIRIFGDVPAMWFRLGNWIFGRRSEIQLTIAS